MTPKIVSSCENSIYSQKEFPTQSWIYFRVFYAASDRGQTKKRIIFFPLGDATTWLHSSSSRRLAWVGRSGVSAGK